VTLHNKCHIAVILLDLIWNDLDEGHYYIYFLLPCCWKSKFMALEKSGKLREFFSYFVATLVYFPGPTKPGVALEKLGELNRNFVMQLTFKQ